MKAWLLGEQSAHSSWEQLCRVCGFHDFMEEGHVAVYPILCNRVSDHVLHIRCMGALQRAKRVLGQGEDHEQTKS